MAEVTEEELKRIRELPHNILADIKITHILHELDTKRVPQGIRTEVSAAFDRAMKDCSKFSNDVSSILYMGLMLETFIRRASSSLVAMAGSSASSLIKAGISEEKLDLVKRQIEDTLVEVVTQSLKSDVLRQHVSFTEFISQRGKSR